MVKTKKMDESFFAKLVKEFDAVGEMIRARQDEKQAVIDQFDSEGKRFFFGKISEKTLASSVRKANEEIRVLDNDIRRAIERAGDIVTQARSFVSKQSPKRLRASLSGITGGKKIKKPKRKPVAKKKPVKKKAVKRKPVKRKPVAKKKVRKKK